MQTCVKKRNGTVFARPPQSVVILLIYRQILANHVGSRWSQFWLLGKSVTNLVIQEITGAVWQWRTYRGLKPVSEKKKRLNEVYLPTGGVLKRYLLFS